MATETKRYTVAGILVEAVKTEGGGFYELTIVETGDKQRCLASVFEDIAKPVQDGGFSEPSDGKYEGDE